MSKNSNPVPLLIEQNDFHFYVSCYLHSIHDNAMPRKHYLDEKYVMYHTFVLLCHFNSFKRFPWENYSQTLSFK